MVRLAASGGGVGAMNAFDGRAKPASAAASRAAHERADETRATWRRTKAAPNAPRRTHTRRLVTRHTRAREAQLKNEALFGRTHT